MKTRIEKYETCSTITPPMSEKMRNQKMRLIWVRNQLWLFIKTGHKVSQIGYDEECIDALVSEDTDVTGLQV
jgi:hypothetical protein